MEGQWCEYVVPCDGLAWHPWRVPAPQSKHRIQNKTRIKHSLKVCEWVAVNYSVTTVKIIGKACETEQFREKSAPIKVF